jgi:Uri superfamily endonuclease
MFFSSASHWSRKILDEPWGTCETLKHISIGQLGWVSFRAPCYVFQHLGQTVAVAFVAALDVVGFPTPLRIAFVVGLTPKAEYEGGIVCFVGILYHSRFPTIKRSHGKQTIQELHWRYKLESIGRPGGLVQYHLAADSRGDATKLGPGAYGVLFKLDRDFTLATSRLGEIFYPRGWYVYVGSAMGGISGRLKHHLGPHTRIFWHIDYILPQGNLISVVVGETDQRVECQLDRYQGFRCQGRCHSGHM